MTLRPRSALALAALLAATPAAAQEVPEKEPNRGGTLNLETTDPALARQRLHPAPGYELTLFASERDFPIGNPVAMAFDSRGRLWVATMPTYPQVAPGEQPRDKLIILEDTDNDGRADRHTVFADSLYLPTGFELGDGGVYVAQEPNLVFLRDTDGDGRADERRVILHGFGTEDSHHAIHAFTWGPDGGLYMNEGTFLHSQVETPFGPVRLEEGGVHRYEPKTERFSTYVSYAFANPWGHTFDRWGQNFIADASNGNNYFALPITGRVDYPQKHAMTRMMTNRVRPTGGAELLSSRHFPESVRDNLLISNVIGFQGIKNHRLEPRGAGYTGAEDTPLLTSSDINFRPIDMEVAPDGSLYLVDWFNPLIGHMQYSLRDERRDSRHGRIWRLTAQGRPLLDAPNLEALSVAELLDQLKVYEDRGRYRARRELWSRDPAAVLAERGRWVARLDPAEPEHERHLLEALWLSQALDRVDQPLLKRLLSAKDHRARAAATRVLRHSMDRVEGAVGLLGKQVRDAHPLVRHEAVVALSFVPTVEAAELALEARRHPTDYFMEYSLGETLTALEPQWKPALLAGRPVAADNPEGLLLLLDRLTPAELARVPRGAAVNRALLARSRVPLESRRQALAALPAAERAPALLAALAAPMLAPVARDTVPGLGPVAGAPSPSKQRPRRVEVDLPAAPAPTGDLVTLLLDSEPAELRRHRRELESLATASPTMEGRRGAWAALLRAEGRADRIWKLASRTPQGAAELVAAAPLVRDPAVQAELYPRVRDAVRQRMAAGADPVLTEGVRALAAMTGNEAERLALFGELLERRLATDLAVQGAAGILASGWQGEGAATMAPRVMAYAREIDPAERRGPAFEGVMALGRGVAARLPGEQGTRFLTELSDLAVRRVRIRAVPSQMKFDIERFEVVAGEEVEIVFENADEMPHNVVVTLPDSREEVGRAADAMAATPNGFEKNFVPEMREVLHATPLISGGETVSLRFTAPQQPGRYPYICSFPGHWITMFGDMVVGRK